MAINIKTNNKVIPYDDNYRPKIGGRCGKCGEDLVLGFEKERYRDTIQNTFGHYSYECPVCGAKNHLNERIYENYIDIYEQSKVSKEIKKEIIECLETNFNRFYIEKKIKLITKDLEFVMGELIILGRIANPQMSRIRFESEAFCELTELLEKVDSNRVVVKETHVVPSVSRYDIN